MKNKCLQLFFGVSLFFCLAFLSIPDVKAVSNVYLDSTGYNYHQVKDGTNDGFFTFSNTINSSCGNSYLIAEVFTYSDGNTFGSATYDGVAMADSGLGQQTYPGGSAGRVQFFILKSPNSGTKNFHIKNNRGSQSDDMTAILRTYCNVNQTTPVDLQQKVNSSSGGSPVPSGNFNITNNNSFVLYYTFGNGAVISTSTAGYATTSKQTYDNGNFELAMSNSSVNSKITTDYYNISLSHTSTNGYHYGYLFVLNYSPAEYCGDTICNGGETNLTCLADCSYSYIYWAGVGTQNGIRNSNYNIPFYYNFCGDYSGINSADVCLNSNDSGVNYENCQTVLFPMDQLIGPQKCSGIAYYTAWIPPSATTTSAYFELNLYDVDGINLATDNSVPFNVSLNYEGDASGAYVMAMFDNPLQVNLTTQETSTSTNLGFLADFGNLDWTGTSVCIFNTDGSNTGRCTAITATTSISNIVFDVPARDFIFDGYFGSDTFLWMKSDRIKINFYETLIDTSLKNLLGTTTATTACTAAEWATQDPILDFGFATTSLAAFNFTKMKCTLLQGALDISDKITGGIKTGLETALSKLLKVFPFVIPANIKKSWDDAATASMPAELSFLTIGDVDGNIDISIPPLYSTGTSTIWHVWGPNLWGNTGAINTMLANWRILTKYLLYAAWFLLVIYGFATYILHKTHEN